MNLEQQEQFYQMMTRLRGSRAASSGKEPTETKVMDGLIVSIPKKKGPEVIDLQEYARSGKSFGGGSSGNINVNKLRMIHDFIASHGRVY